MGGSPKGFKVPSSKCSPRGVPGLGLGVPVRGLVGWGLGSWTGIGGSCVGGFPGLGVGVPALGVVPGLGSGVSAPSGGSLAGIPTALTPPSPHSLHPSCCTTASRTRGGRGGGWALPPQCSTAPAPPPPITYTPVRIYFWNKIVEKALLNSLFCLEGAGGCSGGFRRVPSVPAAPGAGGGLHVGSQ